jgi:Sulfite exporter TauE/SafE
VRWTPLDAEQWRRVSLLTRPTSIGGDVSEILGFGLSSLQRGWTIGCAHRPGRPALVLLFGVDIRYAIGASLISVIATSSGAASAYVREGFSNIRMDMLLEIATTLGAIFGAYLAARVPGKNTRADSGQVFSVLSVVGTPHCSAIISVTRNPRSP